MKPARVDTSEMDNLTISSPRCQDGTCTRSCSSSHCHSYKASPFALLMSASFWFFRILEATISSPRPISHQHFRGGPLFPLYCIIRTLLDHKTNIVASPATRDSQVKGHSKQAQIFHDLACDYTMCFIRVSPKHAPIKPPGAAPTLTSIYDRPVLDTTVDMENPTS